MADSTYFNFCDDISDERSGGVEELISFINNTDGHLTIGIDSTGGQVGLSNFLAYILNRNKNRIKLVLHTFAWSAAFEMLYLFKGEIEVLPGALGMIHYAASRLDIDDRGKPVNPVDKAVMANSKKQRIEREKMAKEVLTPSQFKRFKKGEDVFIYYEQLKEFFEKR